MGENEYTKENIKARMFKLAAAFWGTKKMENLDPVIKLLIESLSNELYRLSDEVDNIEVRMLEKLSNLLTPDILISPSPAHAILHATPIEPLYLLNKESGVYYENAAFDKKHKITNLSFFPACNTLLHRGDIRYIVSNGFFYKVDNDMTKRLIARPDNGFMGDNSVWLGLELDKQIDSLEHLSFYIDFPNTPERGEFCHLLPYTKWYLEDAELKMTQGIYQIPDKYDNEVMELFSKYSILHKIKSNTLKIYHTRFMTVDNKAEFQDRIKVTFPQKLEPYYTEQFIEGFETPMLWLRIHFPPAFTERVLDDMIISINAFPVENVKLYSMSYEVEDISGIIPLNTDNKEFFLSIHSLTNSMNKYYYELPYKDKNFQELGTYSLRRGGCERFDSRNAKDYLNRLIDLLGDESAAFASASRNKLPELAEQMLLQINQMQQAVSTMTEDREIPYYVLVDELEKKEVLFVKYWITHCELGNNLKAGIELVPFSGTLLDPRYTFLLTSTYGGKQGPRSRRKLDMYKYVLTAHDRIVTKEDIINFCQMQLGDIATGIRVEKGVMVSPRPKEGLVKTIDVHITLGIHLKELVMEENLKRDIKNMLMEKSPDTFNYRIILNVES